MSNNARGGYESSSQGSMNRQRRPRTSSGELLRGVTKIDFKNDGVVNGQPAWKLSATMIKK